jgi:glycosyltransferase involved in cell wall biosynthesis
VNARLDPGAETVSVVIPTYNRADLLPRAIASALEQTRAPDEVIVVDDGSTDDTAAGCRAWADRIRYLSVPNGGVSAARNAGIASARGAWIALLDSDDVWEPTKLEVQLTACRTVPDAAWCITGCETVDGAGRSRGGPQSFASVFPVFRDFGYDPDQLFATHLERFDVDAAGAHHVCYRGDLFGLLFLGNVGLPSSALIRRRLMEEIGPFNASLRMAEETEFFHRAASYSPAVVIMSRLVRYRVAQSDSLTTGTNTAPLTEIALQSLDAAFTRRAQREPYREAWNAGRRNLLLRLAYSQLSMRDGAGVRSTLGRLRHLELPLGRRGASLWAASLLPSLVLGALHRAKRGLRRFT